MVTVEKKKTITIPPPTTLEEAAHMGRRIATLLRDVHTHEESFAVKHAALDTEEDALLHPLQQEVLALGKSIYAFAEKHRNALTETGKRKTVTLPGRAGTLSWYTTPASVSISSIEEVLKSIKTLNVPRFIRNKEEINKDAMLEEPALAATISGVTITRQEKFAVKPRNSKERVECTVGTKRWKIAQQGS